MRFTELRLGDAHIVEMERHEDERGFFAQTFCEREFAEHGLSTRFPQCNLSYSRDRLTLRGMHYQAAPHREAKLVRCLAGAIHDMIVDLREGSSTRWLWRAVELDAERRATLLVPAGFTHGIFTLCPHTEVFDQMGGGYELGAARGFRWNDPFAIQWPAPPAVISDRDAGYPDFDAERFDG